MINYNTFHIKNKNIQNKLIGSNNYTYQTLIFLIHKHFECSGIVFDFGCGVGVIDLFLAGKGYSVTGVDISRRAIDLANRSKMQMGLKSIRFVCADISKYGIEGKCDYFICSEVLEHLKDPNQFLLKLNRSVKTGGVGILSVPSSSAPLFRWGLLNHFDKKVGHLRRYDRESFRALLVNGGFQVVEEYEVEGLFRNLIYTNVFFGWMVKFIRYPFSLLVNLFDRLLLNIFGPSNYYYVVKKI